LRLARQAGVVLAVGIRPCTGAILVLLFTLAQGLLAVGIAATAMMAAGTAITVAVLALLAVASRRLAEEAGSRAGVGRAVPVIGAGLVAAVGLVLFVGTLGTAGPPL
jgi:ABC-type nickel/cobalt efflux system permease component RcnA